MRQTLTSIEPQGDGYKLLFTCTVDIEGGPKPACVAETVGILYERK
jgi:hypothetical protein